MEPGVKKSKISVIESVTLKSHSRMKSATSQKSISRLKMRKASYGFGALPGIRTVEKRSSQHALDYKRPPVIYLNTYQLDPHVRFHVPAVKKVAEALLDEHFTEYQYSSQDSPVFTMCLAGELMRQVKAMNFNRYRIFAVVTMGQKRAQSYNNSVGFLWDHERDSFVNVHREHHTAFIQVTVFGVYLD